MTKYICAIIISILIILLFYNYKKENMTRIYRGVGALNDADSPAVASGVVNSMPLFDYTYTFWDGVEQASCDDCSTPSLCPTCPNYSVTKINGSGPMTHATVNGAAAPMTTIDESFAPSRSSGYSEYDGADDGGTLPIPADQDDLQFMTQREKIGGNWSVRYYPYFNSPCNRTRYHKDEFPYTGDPNPFDREGSPVTLGIKPGGCAQLGRTSPVSLANFKNTSDQTLKIISVNMLGLENVKRCAPEPDPSTYWNYNGYLYKPQIPGEDSEPLVDVTI